MPSTSPYARRLPALALVAALVAGCGSGAGRPEAAPPGPPADAVVLAAAAKSSGTGSSRISVSSTTAINGQDVAFVGEGAYDYVKKTGQLSFQVPGADGRPESGGTIEQRIVGESLYLSLPPKKTVFYRLRLRDVAGTSVGGSADPTATLQALQALSGVQQVGKEQVRGVETTHYRGSYDAAEAIAKAEGAAKTILQTALRGAQVEAVPFDAFLDPEGRLVKLVQTLELPGDPATGGVPVRSQTTLELYDFGTTVTVVVPPAASVRDGAPLLAALRQALPMTPPPSPPAPASPASPPASPAR